MQVGGDVREREELAGQETWEIGLGREPCRYLEPEEPQQHPNFGWGGGTRRTRRETAEEKLPESFPSPRSPSALGSDRLHLQ